MKQHPLKVERELRGWSQATVAEALNTTVRTVSRWEQGQTLPYPFYREQLCRLFGKDARQLGLLPEHEEEETVPSASPPSEDPPVSQLPSPVSLPPPPSEAVETVSGPYPQSSVEQASKLHDPTLPEALGSTSSLVGREPVLQRAKQFLFDEGRLALYGLPGVGKTALSMVLATDPQLQARFQDGILWAGLGPQPDILSMLIRWGKLLGITPSEVENAGRGSGSSPLEDWRRALRAAIGQRSLLLVIDDVWSVNDALALQVGGPRCAYLLTTRQPQVAFAFSPEKTSNIHELVEADGLALLARFVPQLVQQEPEEARALAREVGGLPLALMLMGKYLAAHFLPGQPYRIRRALTQLHQAMQRLQVSTSDKSSSTLPLDVPLSLHAAIAISDQQLSLPAHEALCALSVFPAKPDSFTEEAALAVADVPIEVLDELWDSGLLESAGPGRYCLHRTIVNYAQAQSGQELASDSASTAQRRLVRYMVEYANEHQQDYEMLEREANILWVAMDTATRLELWRDLVQGGIALVPFMHVRGLYSQADQLLQQALYATLQLEDQLARATVLYHLADFANLLGDYSHVEIYGQQGLELAQRLDQQGSQGACPCDFLYLLGSIWRKRGDYIQAKRLLEEGLRLARPLNDPERICHLLNELGMLLHYQGDYTQSGIYHTEALALARQTGFQELVSRQLASLSILEQEQGNYTQAEAYCQEGMQLAWQVGYQEQLCFHLNTLGLIAVQRRAYSQAEAYYLEALAQARRIGHRAHICTILTNLGDLSELRGDYVQAERYCQEGVELARQIGLRHSLAVLLLHLGYAIGMQEGTYHRANTCFQECLEIIHHLRRDSGLPLSASSPSASSSSLPTLSLSRLINTMYVLWGEIHLKYQNLDAATAAFHIVVEPALTHQFDKDEQEHGGESYIPLSSHLSENEPGGGNEPLPFGVAPTEQDLALRAQAQYGLARIVARQGATTEAHRLGEECATTLERLGRSKAREVRQWLTSLSVSDRII
jgi:tetratricopeptide (TPR) repeat protein/DNA-binding XRE family transcriptional regulator